MSRIKKRDTKAEIALRKYLWKNKLRGYRLKNNMPGNPDLCFPKKRLAIFVDGCFWHKCPKCFRRPKSNNSYWDAKIAYNVKRDKRTNSVLKSEDIVYLRLWEHDVHTNLKYCFEKIYNLYMRL